MTTATIFSVIALIVTFIATPQKFDLRFWSLFLNLEGIALLACAFTVSSEARLTAKIGDWLKWFFTVKSGQPVFYRPVFFYAGLASAAVSTVMSKFL